jgi:hypothetical protein
MSHEVAVKVSYWAVPDATRPSFLIDLEGIAEFRQELSQQYLTVVHGRSGSCGGGLYHLAIEVISTLGLASLAHEVLKATASDVSKRLAKALLLDPLFKAYQRLRSRNSRLDIGELRVVLQDTTLIIYRITNDSVSSHLDRVLEAVAKNLPLLLLRSGEAPYEIHVPVFEDPVSDRLSRFRALLTLDECIVPSSADYFRYWGLVYGLSPSLRVFDVERGLLLDEEFLTEERYEQEFTLRFERSRPKPPEAGV